MSLVGEKHQTKLWRGGEESLYCGGMSCLCSVFGFQPHQCFQPPAQRLVFPFMPLNGFCLLLNSLHLFPAKLTMQVPLVKPQTLARTESSLETLRFLAGTGGDGRWELCCSLCWPCLQCFSQLGAGKQASCLPSAPVLQGWFYSIRRYMVAF